MRKDNLNFIFRVLFSIGNFLWKFYKKFNWYAPIMDDCILWYWEERNDPFRVTINSLVSHFESTLNEYTEIKGRQDVSRKGDSLVKLAASNQKKYTQKTSVLFLIHWYELGGVESFALDTLRWANELGMYTIIIATIPCWHTDVSLFEKIANELYYVDERGSINHQSFEQFLFVKINQKKVNIIHIHHSLMGYEALPKIKEKHPNIKIVDTLHIVEYKAWHTHLLLLKKNETSYVERCGFGNFPGGFPSIAISFNRYIDQTHVISQTLAKFLIHEGIKKEKIVLRYLVKPLPNIKNVETKIRKRYEKKIKEKKISISFIGRLVFQKKPYVFVKLIKKLNQQMRYRLGERILLEFHIFGDGEYRTYIENEEKKITNLKFWGKGVKLEEMMAHSDIVILPSRNEGITLTAFECAMAGVIFFCTNVGAQAEFIPAKFLVKNSPFPHRALQKKITRFLDEPTTFIDELIKWRKKTIKLLQYSADKEWLEHFYR